MTRVYCWNCGRELKVDTRDFWETAEDATMKTAKCDSCSEVSAVSWSTSVDFSTLRATAEDIKEYPPEAE